MPNHITNKITWKWSKQDLDILIDKVNWPNWEFDFNKIIPQPDNIFLWDLSQKDKEECRLKWIPNWYDWNIKNWWTKWNAYDISFDRVSDKKLIIQFDTTWSTPEPVLKQMWIKFPDITFKVEYADEDIWYNAWVFKIKWDDIEWQSKQWCDSFCRRIKWIGS